MENMITIFIVIAIALLVFLFFVLRSAYGNSHVPVGSVLKRKGILFKVKRYNKSDHIDKCLRCDMRFFPSISGYNDHCCVKVPFCNASERRDKTDVYYELVGKNGGFFNKEEE